MSVSAREFGNLFLFGTTAEPGELPKDITLSRLKDLSREALGEAQAWTTIKVAPDVFRAIRSLVPRGLEAPTWRGIKIVESALLPPGFGQAFDVLGNPVATLDMRPREEARA